MLLLEDSGALLGLACALLGVALALITGEPVFDGIGTLAIGLVLFASRSSWRARCAAC